MRTVPQTSRFAMEDVRRNTIPTSAKPPSSNPKPDNGQAKSEESKKSTPIKT